MALYFNITNIKVNLLHNLLNLCLFCEYKIARKAECVFVATLLARFLTSWNVWDISVSVVSYYTK